MNIDAFISQFEHLFLRIVVVQVGQLVLPSTPFRVYIY